MLNSATNIIRSVLSAPGTLANSLQLFVDRYRISSGTIFSCVSLINGCDISSTIWAYVSRHIQRGYDHKFIFVRYISLQKKYL